MQRPGYSYVSNEQKMKKAQTLRFNPFYISYNNSTTFQGHKIFVSLAL